jgi:hypothetical protein
MSNDGSVLKGAKALTLNPNQREMVLELSTRTRAVALEWIKSGRTEECGFSMVMLSDWMRIAVGEKPHWELSPAEQDAIDAEISALVNTADGGER